MKTKRLMTGLMSGLLATAMVGAAGPASAEPPRFLGIIICIDNAGGGDSFLLSDIDPNGVTKKQLAALRRTEIGNDPDQCDRSTWDDSGVFQV